MMNQWIRKPKATILALLVLALAFAVACGAAATATPAPAAPKAPVAAAPAAPVAPAAAATAVPTAAPRPTPAPVAKPKVERLIVAWSPLGYETNLPWAATAVGALQQRPILETLVGVDQATGAHIPMLATKWEVAPDGKRWTFWLKEKAPWHFGLGEFSAKDVVHSWQRITAEDSIASDAGIWKGLVAKAEDFKTITDHQIEVNLKRVEPDLDFSYAVRTGNMLITSKAQWDNEGKVGMERRLSGTGPYQFKERKLGEYILYERVANHWRVTPEYKELMWRFVSEDSTRLAMALAREAHIIDLPRDLQGQALGKGLKLVSSKLPGLQHQWMFGGLYFSTPDKLDPKLPFANKKVREAMNRAVNRKEIIDTIFQGRAEPVRVFAYHPSVEGWDPQWEKRFNDLYGYDPKKAKALLAEAGYPNGFKAKLYLYPWSGFSEIIQVGEALGLYFQAIGIQVELEQLEFSKVRDLYRKRDIHGAMWGLPGTLRPPYVTSTLYYNTGPAGVARAYEHAFIDQKHDELAKTIDRAERARIQREIGNHLFEEYASVPIVWISNEIIVDPSQVADYTFPGNITGFLTHLEYVKPVK